MGLEKMGADLFQSKLEGYSSVQTTLAFLHELGTRSWWTDALTVC